MRPRRKSRNGRFFGGRTPVFGYKRKFLSTARGFWWKFPACLAGREIVALKSRLSALRNGIATLSGGGQLPCRVKIEIQIKFSGAHRKTGAPRCFLKEAVARGEEREKHYRASGTYFFRGGRAGAVVRRGEGEISSGAPRIFSGETCGRGCLRGREKGMPFVRAAVGGSGEQTINFPIAACGRISSCRLRKKAVVCLKSFPLIYR